MAEKPSSSRIGGNRLGNSLEVTWALYIRGLEDTEDEDTFVHKTLKQGTLR